ncbi:alpha-ketoglutarate-dependent dioxygenase AlkB-like protein [Haematococcus lacustris]
MHLRMMSLGKHWEPRTHSYEPARASHDGAAPPPLPASLTSLCQEALAAAQAIPVQGACLPPLAPDVCLVNFYEKTGRLGMHQDKDESSDSLRRGLPVVSMSLGDAADFLFGSTCEESTAQRVRLESGDVLVFGGPSRMVFHAVPNIYPGTAPPSLVQATGLRPGRLNLTFRQT